MRHIHDLPVLMLGPVTNKAMAEAWLDELCRAGLDHHPDDDPIDCLSGTDLSHMTRWWVHERMVWCGALHDDCDVYEALARAHRRVHGRASALNDFNYCVDGHTYPNEESDLAGDGEHPPFRVFDIAAQDYEPGTYPTREAAEAVAAELNAAWRVS